MPRTSAFRPVPGPIDRDTFLAQQRRYRRRIWQLDAVCALGVLLMGIPLSVIVSPLAWAALVLASDLINLATPVPNAGTALFRILDRVLGAPGPAPPAAAAGLAAALVVPGIVAILVAWVGLRAFARRSATTAILRAVGARPPRPDDFDEHQLTNLVEEMSIAAGVPAPRVMLLDTRAANAGAVGVSHTDAVVIVSRGLLDTLDRDQTEAAVAHVIASIGNGDLPASLLLVAVALSLGFVSALLGSPVNRRSRAAVIDLFRFALGRRGDPDADAARLCEMLATEEDNNADESSGQARIRDVLRLPFVMAQAAFWMNRKILLGLIGGPAIAYLWRARRCLADAGAVQLTRYPDALAGALLRLAGQDDSIPGTAWSAHVFIVGPNAGLDGRTRKADRPDEPIDSILPFDPPLRVRLAHLRAAGATLEPPPAPHPLSRRAKSILFAIGAPLIAAFAMLMAGVALALVYLTLAIDMLFLMPMAGGLHLLLRAAATSWLGR
jgi:Zn-dependent protease with chaperone function